MFRGTVAEAGAHAADVRDAVQEVLYTASVAVVVWERGHKRLHLGGVPVGRGTRIRTRLWPGCFASADATSAQKQRVSEGIGSREAWYRDAGSGPEGTR